jgi:Tol biopolymer transport system component
VTLQKYNRVSGQLERNIVVFSADLDLGFPQNSSLAWSPDGLYLAFIPVFSNIHMGNRQLLLIHADGSGLQPLVVLERGVGDFTWSPDGRWIAFSSGGEVWAASLEAFEANQNYLVRISYTSGFSLSWQPAPCKLKVCL